MENTKDFNPKLDKEEFIIENFSANWMCTKNKQFCLRELSIKIKPGSLFCIIGSVGSGKSALILSLLNELGCKSSNNKWKEMSYSYAPQKAWIFNGTIKENIIFYNKFDHEKYNKVIKCVSFEKDIERFLFGDETLVGEYGLRLSGGQKSRISLARCIYSDANVYLLDDPFSSLDSTVADEIFNETILKHLKNKIVILATHQLRLLNNAENILWIENGKKYAEGNFQTISKILNNTHSQFKYVIDINEESVTPKKKSLDSIPVKEKKDDFEQLNYNDIKSSFTSYILYLNSGNKIILIISLICCLFFVCLKFYSTYLITKTSENLTNITTMSYDSQLFDKNLLYAYIIYGTLGIFGHIFYMISFFQYAFIVSKNMHNKLFMRVVDGTMKFFDSVAIGNILNRFSIDLFIVDRKIPYIATGTLEIVLTSFLSIFLSIITVPWLAIVLIFLILIVILFVKFSWEQLKYCKIKECQNQTPIFNHITDTFNGIVNIRTLGKSNKFNEMFYDCFDKQVSASILFMVISRGVGLRISIALSIFIILFAFTSLSLSVTNDVSLMATTFMFLNSAIETFEFIIRQMTEIDNMFTSVERINHFSNIDVEERDKYELKAIKNWPKSGNISFQNVSLQYEKKNPIFALKNISFSIKNGMKVGIIGRTGSGKSSMFQALFRLFEPTGQIILDGVDILKLSLTEARQHLVIVSQDPILFVGTIRENLDFFNEHSDESLWKVLEKMQLKEKVAKLPGNLNYKLTCGENLSSGEKQLLCLGRALLKDCKVFCIDEATANVDNETDRIIQEVLNNELAGKTRLIIAHRLSTIKDADLILVLKNGNLIKVGCPSKIWSTIEEEFEEN